MKRSEYDMKANPMADLGKYIVPIWTADPTGGPILEGSGTLIQIASKRLLLTSAHVLDAWLVCNKALRYPHSGGLRELVVHDGALTNAPNGKSRNADLNDAGFLDLDIKVSAELELMGYAFLPVAAFNADETPTPNSVYLFTGYPEQWNRIEDGVIRLSSAFYAETICEERTYRKLGYHLNRHLMVDFKKRLSGSSAEGIQQDLTDPAGMSGGAIWCQHRFDDNGVDTLQSSFVGICMEIRRKKQYHVLVGVRAHGILEIIRAKFPELSTFIPGSTIYQPQLRKRV